MSLKPSALTIVSPAMGVTTVTSTSPSRPGARPLFSPLLSTTTSTTAGGLSTSTNSDLRSNGAETVSTITTTTGLNSASKRNDNTSSCIPTTTIITSLPESQGGSVAGTPKNVVTHHHDDDDDAENDDKVPFSSYEKAGRWTKYEPNLDGESTSSAVGNNNTSKLTWKDLGVIKLGFVDVKESPKLWVKCESFAPDVSYYPSIKSGMIPTCTDCLKKIMVTESTGKSTEYSSEAALLSSCCGKKKCVYCVVGCDAGECKVVEYRSKPEGEDPCGLPLTTQSFIVPPPTFNHHRPQKQPGEQKEDIDVIANAQSASIANGELTKGRGGRGGGGGMHYHGGGGRHIFGLPEHVHGRDGFYPGYLRYGEGGYMLGAGLGGFVDGSLTGGEYYDYPVPGTYYDPIRGVYCYPSPTSRPFSSIAGQQKNLQLSSEMKQRLDQDKIGDKSMIALPRPQISTPYHHHLHPPQYPTTCYPYSYFSEPSGYPVVAPPVITPPHITCLPYWMRPRIVQVKPSKYWQVSKRQPVAVIKPIRFKGRQNQRSLAAKASQREYGHQQLVGGEFAKGLKKMWFGQKPHPESHYVDSGKPAPWSNKALWWYCGKNLNRYRPMSEGVVYSSNPNFCLEMPCPYNSKNEESFVVYVGEEKKVCNNGKDHELVCNSSRCVAFDRKTQIKCVYQADCRDVCVGCGKHHYCSTIHANYVAEVTLKIKYPNGRTCEKEGAKKFYYCPTEEQFFVLC